ncbi:hypothetical protein DI09_4p190 [Mitosporidium daphniae]|uniref:UV excision repair protein RAD23 n=1 Tax=Mitosporidium daphniae TaxID=1485682 RepID=A0A098VTB5_9MICR|nr:uncharacterized protein DI09_4p190 [Mitosporidium daphniae]KGG50936.1 hypothetical protein DI09_4p190 [Mitosporidium daphniae]|eukprot:XP_013237363.1 uncharacterized protein DI09_4p190 [Mitosporidium daphniae]
MVQFLPFNIRDEDSIGDILSHIDNAIQYSEHQEPREPRTFSIEVDDGASIQTVKQTIEAQEGFGFASQIIIFQGNSGFLFVGKVLGDSSTISSCNVKDKDFLVMMIKKKVSATSPVPPVSAIQSETKKLPEVAKEAPPANGAADTENTSEHEIEILTLMEMGGFDRDIVVKAMKAAFNDPDRAAEYLFSEPSDNDTYGLSAGNGGLQSLSFLKTDPQFQQLRALLNRQPHLLQPLLQQIGSTEFLALLEEDDEEEGQGATDNNDSEQEVFDEEVSEEINEDIDVPDQILGQNAVLESSGMPIESATAIPHTQYIQVSSQEKEAIDRLVDLGFPRQRAIEAFFACDKDESLAANYLFDTPNDDDTGINREDAIND